MIEAANQSKDSRSRKSIPESTWAEAEALYATGDFNLADLEEKFGIRRETLSRRFKKRGIKKGQATVSEQVMEAVAKAAIDDATIIAQRAKESRDESYAWTQILQKMVMKEIADAKRNGKEVMVVGPNVKVLTEAMKLISMGWDTRSKILGLDKEKMESEELPELVISELTQDEIESIRSAQEQGDVPIDEDIADLSDIVDEDEEVDEDE